MSLSSRFRCGADSLLPKLLSGAERVKTGPEYFGKVKVLNAWTSMYEFN